MHFHLNAGTIASEQRFRAPVSEKNRVFVWITRVILMVPSNLYVFEQNGAVSASSSICQTLSVWFLLRLLITGTAGITQIRSLRQCQTFGLKQNSSWTVAGCKAPYPVLLFLYFFESLFADSVYCDFALNTFRCWAGISCGPCVSVLTGWYPTYFWSRYQILQLVFALRRKSLPIMIRKKRAFCLTIVPFQDTPYKRGLNPGWFGKAFHQNHL